MTYVLVIGLILAILPILVLEVLAHVVFINMLRDDDDSAKLFSFAVGVVFFGILLIGIHFGVKLV